MSTVPALFRGLVDDAALFPPGNAPIARAVAEHRHHRAAPYADLVGRFLCRDTRVGELTNALGAEDRFRLGLIADAGAHEVALTVAALRHGAAGAITVEAVEIPLAHDDDLPASVAVTAHVVPNVTTYLEIPRAPGWLDAVAACGAERAGAKLRTGGLVAGAFPTEREVADFITACVEHRVPFKCTAGLHHAVRHTAPDTGFEHHGFLNILVATSEAGTGGDVAGAVAERDGRLLAKACASVDAGSTRAAFVGYGSCSVAEPMEDLAALGLLGPDLLAHLPAASEEHA